EERIPHLTGQCRERDLGTDAEVAHHSLERLAKVRIRGLFCAVDERHLPDRETRIPDEFDRIDFESRSEAVTFAAGSVGAVKRERPRFELGNRNAAIDTGHSFGVETLLPIDN